MCWGWSPIFSNLSIFYGHPVSFTIASTIFQSSFPAGPVAPFWLPVLLLPKVGKATLLRFFFRGMRPWKPGKIRGTSFKNTRESVTNTCWHRLWNWYIQLFFDNFSDTSVFWPFLWHVYSDSYSDNHSDTFSLIYMDMSPNICSDISSNGI